MDISVITYLTNKSLFEAVAYCKSRNVSVEIVEDIKYARGTYICDLTAFDIPNTYFHEYFFHVQFGLLHINKHYDTLTYSKTVHYNKETDGFTARVEDRSCFYKKGFKHSKKTWYEDNIIWYCDKSPKKSDTTENLPEDCFLLRYIEYLNL